MNKLKKTWLLLVIVFLLSTYSFSCAEDLSIFGESAILMDVDTSEILYEKNIHSKHFPASTTKIMTGILAIEHGNLNDIVTIDQEVVNLTDGSHIALEPGEQLSLEQLLNALLIESANDSALAIAKHISGDLNSFYQLMNDKAKELGALNTNFVNPNGLHDDAHVTSAYDLALIARYAMENEIFRNIVKNHTSIIPITNKKSEPRYLNSANKLLYSNQKINVDGELVPIKYDGVNGVKTGYTSVSQSCLVASVEKDGHKFISVVLRSNGTNIFSDTHKLFNYGFENFDSIRIGFGNKFIDNFKVVNGSVPFVSGVTSEDSFFIVNKKDKNNIEEKIIPIDEIEAPIKKNQILGKLQYFLNDKVIGETDIVSTMDVDLVPKPTLVNKILDKWYIYVFILLGIFRVYSLDRRRRLRRKRYKRNLYRI